MSAATIPFAACSSESRRWTPSDRDRLVFQWVKFEGKTQGWVAEQLEIHQSTVSRMVERYEKWIAHGGQGRQGALTHDERVRAQRWLTFERNEWILSSALRIAAEMEQPVDATKSTVSRPAHSPSQETEVRTQHTTVDRSGVANRYLRLAFRINMEQLKLVEEEPLPDLEPLTMEDVGEDRLPAVVEEASQRMEVGDPLLENSEQRPPAVIPTGDKHTLEVRIAPNAAVEVSGAERPVATDDEAAGCLHSTHNSLVEESTVRQDGAIAWGENAGDEKRPPAACQEVVSPPKMVDSARIGSVPTKQPAAAQVADRLALTAGQLPGR